MSNEIRERFWEKVPLTEMSEAEWEAVCDGCGKCCFRKFIEGRGRREKLYYTRIACNLLDLETGKCGNYPNRFTLERDCTKLTKKNLPQFGWLPATCAYRLLYENRPLPDWHPLICGTTERVRTIPNGIHEKEVIDWFEFVIDEV